MTIKKILETKKTLFSLEVFPPKQQSNFDGVISTAQELCKLHPDFMSITYGAGGTSRENTVEIASKILSFGTPAIAHLTCIGNSLDEVKSVIARLK
jgi:methylenetetrahydrofolate reductase (NADPH)